MNKNKKWLIFGIIFAAFVLAMYLLYYSPNSTPGQYDDFAKCLNEKGVKAYTAYWCQHCKQQKEMFGDSWGYINDIECSLPNAAGQNEVCNKAGISGYPTWELGNGTRLSGTQSFETLSQLANCPIDSQS